MGKTKKRKEHTRKEKKENLKRHFYYIDRLKSCQSCQVYCNQSTKQLFIISQHFPHFLEICRHFPHFNDEKFYKVFTIHFFTILKPLAIKSFTFFEYFKILNKLRKITAKR